MILYFLKEVGNLDFHILNTKNPHDKEVGLVERAFEFWKGSWEKTFSDINVNYGGKLYSDDFLDREMFALFDGSKPVGLFFNSQYTNTNSQRSHSYFKNYPSDFFMKIKKLQIDSFMTLSYMTIDPEWTKRYTDSPISEVLFSLSMINFKRSSLDYLVGYIRRDRGKFHEVFSRHGARLLMSSKAYNVDVDFMYVPKKEALLSDHHNAKQKAQYLWNKRQILNNDNQNAITEVRI